MKEKDMEEKEDEFQLWEGGILPVAHDRSHATRGDGVSYYPGASLSGNIPEDRRTHFTPDLRTEPSGRHQFVEILYDNDGNPIGFTTYYK